MLKTSKICVVVAKCERDKTFYNVELSRRTLRLLYNFLLGNAILIYAGRPAAQSALLTFELFTVQGYN